MTQDTAQLFSQTGECDFRLDGLQPGIVKILVADGPCNDDGPLRLTLTREAWEAIGSPETIKVTLAARCRECGCTDDEACLGGCSWVAPALCSSCGPTS